VYAADQRAFVAVPSDAAESEPKELLRQETALAMHCVFELPLQTRNEVTVLFLLEMIMYVWEAFQIQLFILRIKFHREP